VLIELLEMLRNDLMFRDIHGSAHELELERRLTVE
jgi:hypothetical protein